MEMSGTQLAQRMLGSIARVDQHKMRTGRLTDKEWSDLSDAMAKLHETPIYIDEAGALTALEVRARARRLKRQYSKLGLIVIDYLQLMSALDAGREPRHRDLRDLALAEGDGEGARRAGGGAVAAEPRRSSSGPNKRPLMADLRESGAIEQDADVILLIYRDEVYNHDTPDKGIAEIIILKQRNGPIGTVKLTFLGQSHPFRELRRPRHVLAAYPLLIASRSSGLPGPSSSRNEPSMCPVTGRVKSRRTPRAST